MIWWETILIAVIPSLLSIIVTNFFNRKKYKVEIDKLRTEVRSSESKNTQIMLENYNTILEQYKIELLDVNKRFINYIEQSSAMAELQKKSMENLTKDVSEKKAKIQELERKINALIKEACLNKGCSVREYFKEAKNENSNK